MELFRIFAAVVSLGILLSGGCADAPSDDASAAPDETMPESASPSATTPPGAALSYGGEKVAGELGSYCWMSRSDGEGELATAECVDAVYPLVPGEEKRLAVPAGSQMVFDYEGEEPPDTVEAGAEPLGPDGKPDGSSVSLGVSRSGGESSVLADLPAGEHVVSVFVNAPQGDVSYYFRVAVWRGEGRLPESGDPEPPGEAAHLDLARR